MVVQWVQGPWFDVLPIFQCHLHSQLSTYHNNSTFSNPKFDTTKSRFIHWTFTKKHSHLSLRFFLSMQYKIHPNHACKNFLTLLHVTAYFDMSWGIKCSTAGIKEDWCIEVGSNTCTFYILHVTFTQVTFWK